MLKDKGRREEPTPSPKGGHGTPIRGVQSNWEGKTEEQEVLERRGDHSLGKGGKRWNCKIDHEKEGGGDDSVKGGCCK